MKIKTKLIPLVSTVITCASIVPTTLTGCSTGYIGHSFNVCKPFYPIIQKHECEELSRFNAHEDYTQQLQKDLTTFVQDFMWSQAMVGDSFEQFLFWVKLLEDFPAPNSNAEASFPFERREVTGLPSDTYDYNNFVISNLSMRIQEINWLENKWHIPRLSFDLTFNSRISDIYFQETLGKDMVVTGYLNGLCNGNITFYDVPFIITSKIAYYSRDDYDMRIISFEPFAYWMDKDGSDFKDFREHGSYQPPEEDLGYWSIKTNIISTLSGELIYTSGLTQRIADDWLLNINANNEQPEWHVGNIGLYNTLTSIFTSSYYLQEVTLEREA